MKVQQANAQSRQTRLHTRADARQWMLHVNEQQKAFYESRAEALAAGRANQEQAANATTNWWSGMRHAIMQMRNASGTDAQLVHLHQLWLADVLPDARVLDLGCFSGNPLSMWMAERCADYTGIDLSEQAIARLNERLVEHGLPASRARAQALDFLANDFEDGAFDVVYARSVLHHFADIRVALTELRRVVRPGGFIVTLDPLMTEPLNRLARMLYRPLQTDRAWEWPFTRHTLRTIAEMFTVDGMCGYGGMSKLGYPLQLIPGLHGMGRAISAWGARYDTQHTQHLGLALYSCWGVTLRLRYLRL